MAQKHAPESFERDPGRSGKFRSTNPMLDTCKCSTYPGTLRESAASSPDQSERVSSVHLLYDIDSLAFVAETSPYQDSRAAAELGLRARLSSFTPAVIRHLSENSPSFAVRSCAAALAGER